MIYRKAEMSDLPLIHNLVTETVAHLQANGNMQWDERYPCDCDFIPDIESGVQTLVFKDGVLVAVYSLSTERDSQYDAVIWKYEGEPFMVLHRLIVSPDFQGQGIAGAVLSHIIEELRRKGINNIRLDTYRRNAASQHLYRKFGFEDVGVAYFRDKPFDLMELHF